MSFTGGNFTFGGGGAGRFSTALTRGRVQGASPYSVAYPSPFFDIAHTYLPTTVKQLFQFCRYYYLTNPLINAIIQKLSEYPVTDMIIDHEDKEVVLKWKEFFYETARIRPFQVECGLDYNTYGNAAVSLSFPFQKYLKCAHCGFNEQARRIRNHWTFSSNEFRLSCPSCKHTGAATPKDWYYRDASGIKPVRWNVEDIEINYNQITGAYTYFFTIPAPLRADITLGKKEVVEGMPQIFLQAIRQQKGVIFSKSNFFHLKRATIAWQDRGWGLPLVLPVLKDAFYLQIMKKAQEAILVEHIVPLRVLFPQAASGTADPFTTINLTEWRDQVAQEIARWRFDNNYIPIMPLPLGNQTIGGDGKALLLQGEMQQLGEQIIMGMGVPREFLQGGLSYAGTNVSMRMLENGFISYIGRQRQMAIWIMKMVAHFMGWPEVGIRFKPFKMADDLQRKSYLLQLNQAQKISDTTLLADSDLEIKEENEIMMRESAERIEATRKQQLAMAEIQGEAQVIMLKYQQKAQQAMMAAQQGPQAPGEPGGVDGALPPGAAQAQAQAGGQGGAAPTAAAGPPPASVLPAPPHAAALGMSDSVPAEAQSLLGNDKQKPGIDIIQMAEAYATQIAQMQPQQQDQALMALEAQSPELAALVEQFLGKVQSGQAGQATSAGVDQRPLPEKLPARRPAQLV